MGHHGPGPDNNFFRYREFKNSTAAHSLDRSLNCLVSPSAGKPSTEIPVLRAAGVSESIGDPSMELPRECWELIFSFIDHYRHLEHLSLTCKQFLSISDGLRSSLSLPNPSVPSVPSLLARYRNLRSIDLSSFHGCPVDILLQIARSCRNLRRLDLSNQSQVPVRGLVEIGSRINDLKVLVLSRLNILHDEDVFVIARLFPLLEELDISYPRRIGKVSNEGVSVLARSLKGLRRIDISGNDFLSDQSLEHLSTHCPQLTEVAAKDCPFVTMNGLHILISKTPNLVTIRANIGLWHAYDPWIPIFAEARALSCLDVSHSDLKDGLLSLLAEAKLPLRTFNVSYSSGFTYDGILQLLSSHQAVESLDLEGIVFLSDQQMIDLCKFLGKLRFINLNLCWRVGTSTYYRLVRSCPLLQEIRMARTALGKTDTVEIDTEIVNSQVRYLHLACNRNLCDEWSIRALAQACPKLQFLDVSLCPAITQLSVSAVLQRCSELVYLNISHCNQISSFAVESDMPRLQVIRAYGLALCNQDLAAISRRCPQLKVLDLQGCMNLSNEGVESSVGRCRFLKEINLRCCNGVSADIIPRLVFSKPSLRRITPPDGSKLSESQRNLFLRHGCLVNDG